VLLIAETPHADIHPYGHDPLVDALPDDEARRFVRRVGEMIGKTDQAMPPHAKCLEGLAAAPTRTGLSRQGRRP